MHWMAHIACGSHVTGVSAVHAAPLLAAHVPAAVRNLAALPLRIGHFTCNPKKDLINVTLRRSLIATM